MNNNIDSKKHYDLLIEEGNDPFLDSKILKKYMNNWDGELFYNSLDLNSNSFVLEVGIGTGRVANEVLKRGVKKFIGIDISEKTIEKAKINLKQYEDILSFVVCDINELNIENSFDIVYSVLTLLHIKDKELAIYKMINSLKIGGIIVLSVSNDKSEVLDYGTRVLTVYPEDIENYKNILTKFSCEILSIVETDSKFATILKAKKIKL